MDGNCVLYTWNLFRNKNDIESSRFFEECSRTSWSLKLQNNSDNRTKLSLIRHRSDSYSKVIIKSNVTIRHKLTDSMHRTGVSISESGVFSDPITLCEFSWTTDRDFEMVLEIRFHLIVLEESVANRDYTGYFREIFSMLQNKKFCDTVVTAGGTNFEVHQLILAAASPVMASKLDYCAHRGSLKWIDMQYLSADVAMWVLLYMYKQEPLDFSNMTVKAICDLFLAADDLQLPGLKIQAGEHLLLCIDDKNVVEITIFADINNMRYLKEMCLDFLGAQADKIPVWDIDMNLRTRPNIREELSSRFQLGFESSKYIMYRSGNSFPSYSLDDL